MSVVDSFLKKMRMVSDEEDYEDYDDYDDYGDDEEDEDIISSKRVKSKQKVSDDYDDLDDFDDYEDDDDDLPKAQPKRSAPRVTKAPVQPQAKAAKTRKASAPRYEDDYQAGPTILRTVRKDERMNNVCMIMPKSFEDANLIVNKLTDGYGVVMNLEGIDMNAAQRIIDFASGACYALNGNLQKISKKIFMAVPSAVNLSGDFDELVDDVVGLSSVSMK